MVVSVLGLFGVLCLQGSEHGIITESCFAELYAMMVLWFISVARLISLSPSWFLFVVLSITEDPNFCFSIDTQHQLMFPSKPSHVSPDCLCHFTWRLSCLNGRSQRFDCLLHIQTVSACSPTQFAIKTKFRALKPEGRWVPAQGTCCLATGGGGAKRLYLSCRGQY